ncbi:ACCUMULATION AND REPLICATION OF CHLOROPLASTS 3, chloroplastic-like protein [Drosera capensis]
MTSDDNHGEALELTVRILQEKLQGYVNFFIEIDIDALLETDSVTLDEALQTTNRAIFFALNALSILISDFHPKYKYSQDGIAEELTVNELITVLEGYTRGRVGFGFGSTFESSIAQAVHDCPFFSAGLKEPNGIMICIFSGAKFVDSVEVNYLEHAFHTVTGCTQDIIISRVLDPDVAVNTVATTILALGSLKKTSKNKSNIISRLVECAPLLFRFLRILHSESDNPKKCCSTDISSLHYGGENSDKKVSDVEYVQEGTDYVKLPCSERKMLPIGERDNMHSVREHVNHSLCGFGQQHEGSTLGVSGKLKVESEETEVSQVKPSNSWNLEFKETLCGNFIDKGEFMSEDFPNYPSIHGLPVGVKTSEPLSSNITVSRMDSQQILKDDSSVEALGKTSQYFRNKSLTSSREKTADASENFGVLSVRAASMLEAERDSKSRLSPIMEIDYRGGIYKGHCQGGFPEGRGCLKFPDGSSYDGMWRYGKRSGLGRFCFHNGDVFQGSWRDDLMHGKGWFYFHNGDRWFANFWKGRANGEGRFYSKHGGVFFGYFQNGWRHGRFLCISENGARYVEIWKEGVLQSSETLDHDVNGSIDVEYQFMSNDTEELGLWYPPQLSCLDDSIFCILFRFSA